MAKSIAADVGNFVRLENRASSEALVAEAEQMQTLDAQESQWLEQNAQATSITKGRAEGLLEQATRWGIPKRRREYGGHPVWEKK